MAIPEGVTAAANSAICGDFQSAVSGSSPTTPPPASRSGGQIAYVPVVAGDCVGQAGCNTNPPCRSRPGTGRLVPAMKADVHDHRGRPDAARVLRCRPGTWRVRSRAGLARYGSGLGRGPDTFSYPAASGVDCARTGLAAVPVESPPMSCCPRGAYPAAPTAPTSSGRRCWPLPRELATPVLQRLPARPQRPCGTGYAPSVAPRQP